MKPIKLVMSAIGPYAGLMPPIEFTRFTNGGLFLISGATGAGKTMIFDAICYALYGTASGSLRDAKNLRSEYATIETRSFVQFTFEHQNGKYFIERRPPQERQSQRGESMVSDPEKVTLKCPDGRVMEGPSTVNDEIVRLLKVDVAQFKQIAMIAQGEFKELLTEKTKSRTVILRQIFGTGNYKNMEDRLKEHLDAYKDTKREIQRSMLQYFGQVEANENLREELTGLQVQARNTESVWNLSELLAMIEKIIVQDQVLLQEKTAEMEQATAAQEELQTIFANARTNNDFIEKLVRYQKAREELLSRKQKMKELEDLLEKQKAASYEVQPFYREWRGKKKEIQETSGLIAQREAELAQAVEQTEKACEELEAAEKCRPRAEEFQKQVDQINSEEEKYQLRDKLKSDIEELATTKIRLAEQEKKLADETEALKNRIRTLKELCETLKESPVFLQKAKAEREKLEGIFARLQDILERQIPDRESEKRNLSEKQRAFEIARDEYDAAEQKRKDAERILENCRAGILAQSLEAGQCCPVCGSTHHPHLAPLPETAMSEEAYKALQEQAEALRNKKEKANNSAGQALATVQKCEEQLRQTIVELMETPLFSIPTDGKSLEELLPCLQDMLTKVQSSLNENAALILRLEEECESLSVALADKEQAEGKEIVDLDQAKQELVFRKQSVEKDLAADEATMKTLTDLRYETWAQATEARDRARREGKAILDKINNASDRKNQADHRVTSLNASLTTLRNSLNSLTSDLDILFEKLKDACVACGFENYEEMSGFIVAQTVIADRENQINEYREATATNDAQLRQAQEDANGKVLIDLDELQKKVEAQKRVVSTVRSEVDAISNRIHRNTDLKCRIEVQRNDFEESTRKYTMCERLYNIIKGNTPTGKPNITLEQYVQAAGFDRILSAANTRLMHMTNNQYKLHRKEGGFSGRSMDFLDLEVHDYFTGKDRPVTDISGGESFKASLCLALGLSDMISASNGGIQMDALFIDEGFGSLDPDSLNGALNVLMNLSNTNKLVGVISHREELVDSIPQQIKVIKLEEGAGSSFELLVDN